VRRGMDTGTLDQALKTQALAEGVEIEFGHNVEHLSDGGIVALGPRRVDAIAVGYVFPTDRRDGAFGAVSDELAPAGYAYLLICRGRATLATCMFDDFHNDKQYLARSVDFFERKVGITLRDARSFGGFGNKAADPKVRRGRLLLAGEAAGLQDALFGFGMRYALTSGYLAGQAWMDQDLPGYEEAYRRRIRPWIHAAAVNRYLYRRSGARGYRTVVERVCGSRDPRSWLRRRYARLGGHHSCTQLPARKPRASSPDRPLTSAGRAVTARTVAAFVRRPVGMSRTTSRQTRVSVPDRKSLQARSRKEIRRHAGSFTDATTYEIRSCALPFPFWRTPCLTPLLSSHCRLETTTRSSSISTAC
jgi:hypothetical protein